MVIIEEHIESCINLPVAYNWLNLPSNCSGTDAATIEMLLMSAEESFEENTRLRLKVSDVELRVKCWRHKITLPWSPFVELESFEYEDEDGNNVTVDAEDYELVQPGKPAYIKTKFDIYPKLAEKEYPITVKYKVGFTKIPATIQQFVLMTLATGYVKRQSIENDSRAVQVMDTYMKQLIANKRVWRYQ